MLPHVTESEMEDQSMFMSSWLWCFSTFIMSEMGWIKGKKEIEKSSANEFPLTVEARVCQ